MKHYFVFDYKKNDFFFLEKHLSCESLKVTSISYPLKFPISNPLKFSKKICRFQSPKCCTWDSSYEEVLRKR